MGPRQRSSPSFEAGSHGIAALAPLTDYPAALIEVALERVIASDTFRRSQRHRDFLAHIVRAGLAGHQVQLKEVIIGLEVFGRALPDYDPRRDPIVRVEAGRIRDKLARFYDTEGAGEAFQLVIPIGSYLPRLGRRSAVPKTIERLALAVLPFTGIAADSDDAAFAHGLVDQLIDTLGRIPGLKLVARLSASKAQELGADLRETGRVLAVDYVIEGSLQRRGARLRCVAHLSTTKDGLRIWSQRFDHDSDVGDDLFDFEDAIAEAVTKAVSALPVQLPPPTDATLTF